MEEQLSNIYKEAQKALTDDLRQNFYNAVQNRTQAFRQLNNKLNANHSLFSGAPAGQQMQYDKNTLFPSTNSMALQALEKQQKNQENWDSYMSYIKQLNDQAAQYASNAQKLRSGASSISESFANGQGGD